MECPNLNSNIVCKKKNDKFVWTLDESKLEPSISSCPTNSLPWKLDAVCNLVSKTKCWETEYKGQNITICAGTEEAAEENPISKPFSKLLHSIEYTKPIENVELHLDEMMECTRQELDVLKGTVWETWVPKNKPELCQSIITDYENQCDKTDTCDKVEVLYETEDGESSYDCVLDTHKIPTGNKWSDWTRVASYECKDKGWKCTDESLKEYKGGETCEMNDDCHSNFEPGICDNVTNKCKLGNSKGTNCSKDEDCDNLQTIEGKCSSGTCTKGKIGVDVDYYKPLECSSSAKAFEYSKYQYCGKVQRTDESGNPTVKYTGVCEAVPGTSIQACKPFSEGKAGLNEIKNIIDDEQDYLMGINHPVNFYKHSPPWENMIPCDKEDRVDINGKSLCFPTVEKVSMNTKTVVADSMEEAKHKCQLNTKYPLKIAQVI